MGVEVQGRGGEVESLFLPSKLTSYQLSGTLKVSLSEPHTETARVGCASFNL